MTITPEEVLYRPPIWISGAEYSASDDRSLLETVLMTGVGGPWDLRVNAQTGLTVGIVSGRDMGWMAVGVHQMIRGYGIVRGTAQSNDGYYLCPLEHDLSGVNAIDIDPGPAAGQRRYDAVIARVYPADPSGDPPAYWRVEVVKGPPSVDADTDSAVNAAWAIDNVQILAVIGPITSATAQITQNMIIDTRYVGRPAPLGGFWTTTEWMGPVSGPYGPLQSQPYALTEWPTNRAPIIIPASPTPKTVMMQLTGVVRGETTGRSFAYTGIEWAANRASLTLGPGWDYQHFSPDTTLDNGAWMTVNRMGFMTVPAYQEAACCPVIGTAPGFPANHWTNGMITVATFPTGGVAG